MTLFLSYLLKDAINHDALALIFRQMERQQIWISDTERMGLGWRIFNTGDTKIVYHGGITCGFKSLIAFERTSKEGLVILTNAKGLSRKHLDLVKEFSFEFLAG